MQVHLSTVFAVLQLARAGDARRLRKVFDHTPTTRQMVKLVNERDEVLP